MMGIFFFVTALVAAVFATGDVNENDYKKIGCFKKEGSAFTEIPDFQGEGFTVDNYQDKIEPLALNCYQKAKETYQFFAVNSLGKCFGSLDSPASMEVVGNCTTAQPIEESEYVYEMKQRPVDGGASKYTEWGECSKPCGGGKQSRESACIDPLPNDAGKGCGDLTEIRECNTQPCLKPFTCTDKNTGWNDDGSGKVEYLDRHNVRCPTGQVINYFKLERNPEHTKYRYSYKCCTSQLDCTNSEKSNSFTDDGNGKPVYLDRQTVSCDDQNLNQFRLNRDGDHDNIRYQYQCCKIPNTSLSCQDKETADTEDGSGIFASSNTVYLDRQTISCDNEYGLSMFKLARSSDHKKWRYKYRCCKVNQA